MKVKKEFRLPAEWEEQFGVMLTFPHARTDWAPYLAEAEKCFLAIAREILKRENLLVVTPEVEKVEKLFKENGLDGARFFACETNDTWARDHAPLTLFAAKKGEAYFADFGFNGWGMKFAADKDNLISSNLYKGGLPFAGRRLDLRGIVLEGGAVESDGRGTILTTARCLLSENRNYFTKKQAEKMLQQRLGAERVLWLTKGALAGDDTDSHIDTLARFCDERTIAYVRCEDESDEHFIELKAMEAEIKSLRTATGEPYRLMPLPMPKAVYFEGERLPATYANFLILNGAVLVPIYNQASDAAALSVLRAAFPKREIVGVNCEVLIRQHGSLHCVTMQFPKVK